MRIGLDIVMISLLYMKYGLLPISIENNGKLGAVFVPHRDMKRAEIYSSSIDRKITMSIDNERKEIIDMVMDDGQYISASASYNINMQPVGHRLQLKNKWHIYWSYTYNDKKELVKMYLSSDGNDMRVLCNDDSRYTKKLIKNNDDVCWCINNDANGIVNISALSPDKTDTNGTIMRMTKRNQYWKLSLDDNTNIEFIDPSKMSLLSWVKLDGLLKADIKEITTK